MLAKRNQLRAELRGHLTKVLEERGLSNINEASPWSNTPRKPRTPEYTKDFVETSRFLNEEEHRREKSAESMYVNGHGAWYEKPEKNTADHFTRLSAEQQGELLRRQIEEARRRKEEEDRKRAADDVLWDRWSRERGPLTFDASQSEGSLGQSKNDWQAALHQTRGRIEALERELHSVTRQLDSLREEESKIVEFMNGSMANQQAEIRSELSGSLRLPELEQRLEKPSQERPKPIDWQGSQSSVVVVDVEQKVENPPAKPLIVTAKYFVYNAKPRDQLSPKTPSPPHSIHDEHEEELRSVLELPVSQQQKRAVTEVERRPSEYSDRFRDADEDDDDDDDDEEDFTSLAARDALARADASSNDSDRASSRLALRAKANIINTYLDVDMPYEVRGTPHSKLSGNSFDT